MSTGNVAQYNYNIGIVILVVQLLNSLVYQSTEEIEHYKRSLVLCQFSQYANIKSAKANISITSIRVL